MKCDNRITEKETEMKSIKYTEAVWAERGNIERIPDKIAHQMTSAIPPQAVYVSKAEWKKAGRYTLGNPHEELQKYLRWKNNLRANSSTVDNN
jgi:hypothetical protein